MPFFLCNISSLSRNSVLATAAVTGSLEVVVFVLSIILVTRNPKIFALYFAPFTTLLVLLYSISLTIPLVLPLNTSVQGLLKAIFVLQALYPALLAVQLFELTSFTHRNRGVNFCFCVKFEEYGQAKADRRLRITRWIVYGFSVVLLVITVVVHSLVIVEDLTLPTYGNYTICLRGAFFEFLFDSDANIIAPLSLSHLPKGLNIFVEVAEPLSLSIAAVYFGGLLWRYGTFYSFEVYPTYVNPWVSLVLFSLLMILSMFLPDEGILQAISLCLITATSLFIGKLCVNELNAKENISQFLNRKGGNVEGSNNGGERDSDVEQANDTSRKDAVNTTDVAVKLNGNRVADQHSLPIKEMSLPEILLRKKHIFSSSSSSGSNLVMKTEDTSGKVKLSAPSGAVVYVEEETSSVTIS